MAEVAQAAGPFLVSAALLVIGAQVGRGAAQLVIAHRYDPAWEELPEKHKSIDLHPAVVRNMLDWTTDATQLLGIIVAPAVGLIFLAGEVGIAVACLYTAALLSAFAATILFMRRVNPVTYQERPLQMKVRGKTRGSAKWKATPVTIIGVATNLFAAALAAGLTVL